MTEAQEEQNKAGGPRKRRSRRSRRNSRKKAGSGVAQGTAAAAAVDEKETARRSRKSSQPKAEVPKRDAEASPGAKAADAPPAAGPAPETAKTASEATDAKGKRRKRRRVSRSRAPALRTQEAAASEKDAKETPQRETPPPAARGEGATPQRKSAPKTKRRRRAASTQAKSSPTAAAADTDASGRIMLINVAEGEECRIAIIHQERLEELFIERASSESHVGNIYKGRIVNVEPSIQAAFIDFGLPKNGFLHISDLQPQYFPDGGGQIEEVGRKTPRRDRPPIQRCLRRGQEVLVQIIKEGIGTKGPTLTTYISIPGRYLVMMPGMNRLGVSRKIEDEEARRKMRQVLEELNLPRDMGFILRTAGLDKTRRDLQRDHMYLQRLWKLVAQRIKSERAPCELYQESDLVIRTIRDVYASDFSRIIVDDEATAQKVRDFLAIAMPRSTAPVEVYADHEPLFHKYDIEAEIERINARHVPLRSGGSLVIDSTEALVAIDVNSGRYRDLDNAEETAYRINMEAAEEIARQLRLRDLGGLILCDFIDMQGQKHQRGIERALRDALRKHKERAKCLRMSQFGIIEMTRQRMRPSIKRSIYQDCPHCGGSGLVKNPESITLDIMRLLRLATHHKQVETVEVRVSPAVSFQLQNRKRALLHQLEEETSRRIVIRADGNLVLDQHVFECFDRRGGTIRITDTPEETRVPGARPSRRPESGGPSRPAPETDATVFE